MKNDAPGSLLILQAAIFSSITFPLFICYLFGLPIYPLCLQKYSIRRSSRPLSAFLILTNTWLYLPNLVFAPFLEGKKVQESQTSIVIFPSIISPCYLGKERKMYHLFKMADILYKVRKRRICTKSIRMIAHIIFQFFK